MAQSVRGFFHTYIAHESVHLVPDLDYNPLLYIYIYFSLRSYRRIPMHLDSLGGRLISLMLDPDFADI